MLNKKYPPYYIPFNFIKTLKSLHKTVNHKVKFCIHFQQRTAMRMRICTCGQQTGDEEINQTVKF